MKVRKDVYETALTVAVVAVMLAVPFSCLLARAVLAWQERNSARGRLLEPLAA